MRKSKSVAYWFALGAFTMPVANSLAAEGKEASFSLGKVVVTADLREQDSFEVPTSIQVIDGEHIENTGYSNPEQLVKTIPNTNFSRYRAGLGEGNFTIRGIGATTVNVDQTIGFYVDGVPVSSVSEFGPVFFDIDQIEVLRGPQGTLYGRNALGGVFHIKTVEPQADKSGKASYSYGSDSDQRLYLMANTPLGSEDVLARFSLLHNTRDARLENIASGAADVDDHEVTAGRAKISVDASDRLQLLLMADLSDSEMTTGTGVFGSNDSRQVNTLRPARHTKESGGVSLKAEYALDNAMLISSTAIRYQDSWGRGARAEVQSYNPLIPATTPFNNDFTGELDQKTFSQELRLESSVNDGLSWILGGFFQYNDADRLSDLVNVSLNGYERSYATTEDRSVAVFGDLTYDLTERSSVLAGVRVSHDHKKLNYRHEGSLVPVLGFQAAPNQQLALSDSFSDISPRLAYEYQPNDSLNLFAKVSKSYKAGGYNTEFLKTGDDKPYEKESIVSYEAGLKAVSEDGRTEFDLTAFYMDWSDQQILDFSGIGLTSVVNAEESRSVGLEMQFRAMPVSGLLFTAAAGYVDAEFKSVPSGLAAINGNQQPNTSKLTASLGLQYETALNSRLKGYIGGDLSYQSSFYWDVRNTIEEPSHTFLNLSAGAGNDDYQVSVFVKNATDETFNTNAAPAVPGLFLAQAQPGSERELGIKLTTNF